MEIKTALPSPAAPKTEFRERVFEEGPKGPQNEESFGSRLNRMAGVHAEKNLYAEGKNQLNKDSYLKIMMEQLKYQDPYNPVKNEQFTQNIAMMSQLEQQINMNQNLEKIINQGNNTQIAALQLVGKSVVADRAALYHTKDKFTPFTFKLPQDSPDVKVQVVNYAGEVVKTMNLGTQNQGDVTSKWDGQDENGVPLATGKYSFKIQAKGMDGQDILINTKTEGRVTGVTSSAGVTYLMIGEQKIALNDVEMIKEGAPLEQPGAAQAAQNSLTPQKVEEQNKEKTKGESAETQDLQDRIEIAQSLIKDIEEAQDNEPMEKPHLHDSNPIFFMEKDSGYEDE